jgi:hypothetical protein
MISNGLETLPVTEERWMHKDLDCFSGALLINKREAQGVVDDVEAATLGHRYFSMSGLDSVASLERPPS